MVRRLGLKGIWRRVMCCLLLFFVFFLGAGAVSGDLEWNGFGSLGPPKVLFHARGWL